MSRFLGGSFRLSRVTFRSAKRPLKRFVFLGVLSSLLVACPPFVARADSCLEVGRIPLTVDHLYSTPLDSTRSSYLVYRSGGSLSVAKISRPPGTWDVSIQTLYSIPSLVGFEVSTAIAGDYLVVSHRASGQSTAQQFYAPQAFRKISVYHLATGQPLTPPGGNPLPFTQNVTAGWPAFYPSPLWQFEDWKTPFCNGTGEGPIGYTLAGRSNGTFVAANFVQYFTNLEQQYLNAGESFCSPPPYHRHPDGSVVYKQDPVLDSQGNHICDPIHDPATYSCSAFDEGGQLIISGGVRGCRIAGGTPPPDAQCVVRLGPPYPVKFTKQEATSRWGVMNPGARIFAASSLASLSSVALPTSLPSEIETPMGLMRISSMHQPAIHPTKGDLALAVGLEAPNVGETGGVLLFNSTGQFTGFASTFSPGARQGAEGALAPIAHSVFHNSSLFAIGAPEDSPSEVYPDITQPSFVNVVTGTGEILTQFFAKGLNDRLGSSVSAVNAGADGMTEVVAGAPGAVRDDLDGSGYFMVHSVDTEGGEELFTVYTPVGEQAFGKLVAGVAADSHGSPFIAAVASDTSVALYDVNACLTSAEVLFSQFLAAAMLSTLETGVVELTSAAHAAQGKPTVLNSEAQKALDWLLDFTSDSESNRIRNRVLASGSIAAFDAAAIDFHLVAGQFEKVQSALSKAAVKLVKARKALRKARRNGDSSEARANEKKAKRKHSKVLKVVQASSVSMRGVIAQLRAQVQEL